MLLKKEAICVKAIFRLLTLTSEAAGIIFKASCSERAGFIKSL